VIATMDVDDFLLIHRCHALPGVYNPAEDKWYAGDPIRALLRASATRNGRVRQTMDQFLRTHSLEGELPESRPWHLAS
jgi:hypothetical protein